MKKIMFNDRYGLTQAVLEGWKSMTRRILPQSTIEKYALLEDPTIIDDARYNVGEVVAIAQKYSEIGIKPFPFCEAGWCNKMFVCADLMPHHIRITYIKIERLQDISDADCLKEGIRQSVIEYKGKKIVQYTYFREKRTTWYDSPREAFAALIDKVSGKGTWESNPWVFAYEFELVK